MFDTKIKNELINEFKKLIEILDKENIWYSVTAGTLLGASHLKGMIRWDDDIDIMIDLEGFKTLKNKYRDNLVISNDNGYPLLFPKWVGDKSLIHTSPVFIDLFVVIKTDDKRIKKYRSIRNNVRFGVYSVHHNFKPFNNPLRILKFVTYPLMPFYRKNLDYDKVCANLENKDGNKHIIIANPTEGDKENIIPDFSYDRVELEFEGIKVQAIKNWDQYLKHRYGTINLNPPIGKLVQEHLNAYNIRKIIWTEDTYKDN